MAHKRRPLYKYTQIEEPLNLKPGEGISFARIILPDKTLLFHSVGEALTASDEIDSPHRVTARDSCGKHVDIKWVME